MSDLKREYDEIIEQKQKIVEQINELKENDAVKKYFELVKLNENLDEQQLVLYNKMKNEEYDSCEHILVYSEIEHDRCEGRTYKSCACIKCGLNNNVLNREREYLSLQRKVMYDYLSKKYLNGKKTKIVCDLDLARAIYSKIKEKHPDIDDSTAVKYFEIALDDIRKIKVSDERKMNRAKRLSLDSRFKSWNAIDVHHY